MSSVKIKIPLYLLDFDHKGWSRETDFKPDCIGPDYNGPTNQGMVSNFVHYAEAILDPNSPASAYGAKGVFTNNEALREIFSEMDGNSLHQAGYNLSMVCQLLREIVMEPGLCVSVSTETAELIFEFMRQAGFVW